MDGSFDERADAYVRRVADEKFGGSITKLANRIGVAQSTLSRGLAPDRPDRITERVVRRIEEKTGLPFDWSSGAAPSSNVRPAPSARHEDRGDMGPVFASAEGGEGTAALHQGEVVEYRPKPRRYSEVRDLYAFYVVNDSMFPRIQSGEMIWVHPHRTPQIGQEAVFFKRDRPQDEAQVMVKRLARTTAESWVVEQFNPPKTFELDRAEWDAQLVVDIDLNR